jgi:hypothetical protein
VINHLYDAKRQFDLTPHSRFRQKLVFAQVRYVGESPPRLLEKFATGCRQRCGHSGMDTTGESWGIRLNSSSLNFCGGEIKGARAARD